MDEIELNKIEEALFHLKSILERFEGENNYTLSENYLIENCFRTYDLLVSLELLFKSELKLNELEHPIGILLRSGLHDFIYSQYIFNKALKKDSLDLDVLEAEIQEHLSGHFNKMDSSLELIYSLKNLDKFQSFGSKKSYKVLGILKEGRSFAKENKLNYLEAAIDNWEWYSKYEHYGAFTNHMYNQESNELRILTSVKLLLCNPYFSLLILADVNSDLVQINEFESLMDIALTIKIN